MSFPQVQAVDKVPAVNNIPVLYTATIRHPESRERVQKTVEEWQRVIYAKWMKVQKNDPKSLALEQIKDSAAVISDLAVYANSSDLKTVVAFGQGRIHGVAVVSKRQSHRELLFMTTAPHNIPPSKGIRIPHVGAALLRHLCVGANETKIVLKSTKSAQGFYDKMGCDRLVMNDLNNASHSLSRCAHVALRDRYCRGITKTKDTKDNFQIFGD